jgi:hypothetical protein
MKTVNLEIIFPIHNSIKNHVLLTIGRIAEIIGRYSQHRYRIESTWKRIGDEMVYFIEITFKNEISLKEIDDFIIAVMNIHSDIRFEVKP